MQRCSSCGNYFESDNGICPICGANNNAPTLEPAKKKIVRKIVKKSNPLKPILLFALFAFVIIGFIFAWPILFPKYYNNPSFSVGGDEVPGIYNVTGTKKKAVQKETKGEGIYKLTFTYRSGLLSGETISKYVAYMEKFGYISFTTRDRRVGSSESLGLVKDSKVVRGHVILITISGSGSGPYIFEYQNISGTSDQYAVGTTQRIGSVNTGYINIPVSWYRLDNGQNRNVVVYGDRTNKNRMTIRSGGALSSKSYIDQVLMQIEGLKRQGTIDNYYTEAMTMGKDNPGYMFSYRIKQNKVYRKMFIFYNSTKRKIYHITYDSVTANSKYTDLITSFSFEFNNIDNNKPSYSRY